MALRSYSGFALIVGRANGAHPLRICKFANLQLVKAMLCWNYHQNRDPLRTCGEKISVLSVAYIARWTLKRWPMLGMPKKKHRERIGMAQNYLFKVTAVRCSLVWVRYLIWGGADKRFSEVVDLVDRNHENCKVLETRNLLWHIMYLREWGGYENMKFDFNPNKLHWNCIKKWLKCTFYLLFIRRILFNTYTTLI